jgi:asparagine synthase (glutamine-hydrolysing)
MSAIYGCSIDGAHVALQESICGSMSQELVFRGSLVEQEDCAENCTLGARHFTHECLSPLFSNGFCSVVMEGELYNKRQLLDEFNLADNSGDGEIIAAAYRKHGIDFANGLNGIFAIAIYDKASHQLVLIRDHVGSRSLFYSKNKNGLFFATTIKALLSTGLIDRQISITSIQSYFSSTSIAPPDTMFSAIRCLRPGTAIVLSENAAPHEYSYWKIKDIQEDYSRSLSDFSEEVRAVILDAVRLRGGLGGEYGSIVSGGVDSSVVTAILANSADKHKMLPVFSIVFDEKPYSDAALQKIMYDSFNLQPFSAVITSKDYWNILRTSVSRLDCPVNDDAMVGMYRVFDLARTTGCTALFEGEAADELFFTNHVHAERKFQQFLAIPYPLRKLLLAPFFSHTVVGAGLDKKIRRLLFRLGLSDTERRLLVLPSFYRTAHPIVRKELVNKDFDPLATARGYLQETSLQDPLNIYYYGLLKNFLPDDLLFKNERVASANQISNRTPFIDYRLVELALKIPAHFKVTQPTIDDDGTKIVYKKAVKGIIPDEILNRKKTRGFSIPSSTWYLDQLKDEVSDLLFSKNALHREFLDDSYVKEIHLKHRADVSAYHYLMTSLVIFELWLQEYMKK